VAVGTGLAFAEILRRNPSGSNEGIDLTEAMLAKARRKAAQAATKSWRLRIGDAYRLDFTDATFDLLLNSYMFDLLPQADFVRVLTEFRRVLKPGGRLVLLNLARGDGLVSKLWSYVYHLNPALLGGCRGVQLQAAVRDAGFAIESAEQLLQLGVPSEVILAIRR